MKPGNWCVISGAQACREVRRAAGGLSLDAVNLAGLGCGSPLPPPPKLLGTSAGCFFAGGIAGFQLLKVFPCMLGGVSREKHP